MDTKKLNPLLNKVVEFHRPDEIYVKGFLYKDSWDDKYYLKIVETMLGGLEFNQKHYLKEGDEEFIQKAEKPKLMRISMKSWHYRLLKFVMGDKAPTPKTMQNGCPYFWLVMFSLLTCVFVALWKVFVQFIMLLPRVFEWGIEQMVESWLEGLDDDAAYGLYDGYGKLPVTSKMYFHDNRTQFFDSYLKKKYGITDYYSDEAKAKRKEMMEAFRERRRIKSEKREAIEAKRREQEIVRKEKQAIRQANWEKRMTPVNNAFNKLLDKLEDFGAWWKKTFTVKRGRVNNIVKRTKQFVGAIVTLVILAATYFVVNYLALGLMWLIDFCITNWVILVGVVTAAAAFGILYLLYLFITNWVQNIVNKYKGGKRVWYVEPLTWIFYLLKWIAVGIVYGFYYIVIIPIVFIFYRVLFNLLLKPLGILLGKFFVGLWKGLLSSTGIFGEYFGASYSDYCPGLEWVDLDEDDE